MKKDESEQMNTTMIGFDPHLEHCCEFTGGQRVKVPTEAMLLLWEICSARTTIQIMTKHSRIAISAVNVADNASAHTIRKSSAPHLRTRPARATHRTATKAPAMATKAIDVETAVVPRESLACEVAMKGVKGLCRFLLLVGMEIVE